MNIILDILILGTITVFVLYRLYSVLGRKQFPPNEHMGNIIKFPQGSEAKIEDIDDLETPFVKEVEHIRTYDPSFQLKDFLQGARYAFEKIFKDYIKGDMSEVKTYLNKSIQQTFEKEIRYRKEVLHLDLFHIRDVSVTHMSLHRYVAEITVKIISDQVLLTKDRQGNLLEGDPDQVETLTDTWVFSRNLKSKDPNWTLVKIVEK